MSDRVLRSGPLALVADTFGLWVRFLPQLLALALAGTLLNELLIQGAVWLGYHNRLAGLLSLTLVVLVKLVIIVAMFEALRPALPAITQASQTASNAPEPAPPSATPDARRHAWRKFPTVVSRALVPFFVYYAAWGFLGETITDYAREGLGQFNPFDRTYSGSLFDVSGGWWLVGSVALLWAIRRGAKALDKHSSHPALKMLIVLCEAGWTFVGLYVITQWQGGLFKWLADRNIGTLGHDLWQAISHPIGVARAATPTPVEDAPDTLVNTLTKIFFTVLLPLVWLALAALIYRYDVHEKHSGGAGKWSQRMDSAVGRYEKLPTWLRDYVGHFWSGTVSRYRAVANSVYLVLAAGMAPLVTLVVLYCALNWLSAWAWVGLTELIGPHSRVVWAGLVDQISILLGAPSWPGDGVIPQTLKICLLAAALERSFAAGRTWRALQ